MSKLILSKVHHGLIFLKDVFEPIVVRRRSYQIVETAEKRNRHILNFFEPVIWCVFTVVSFHVFFLPEIEFSERLFLDCLIQVLDTPGATPCGEVTLESRNITIIKCFIGIIIRDYIEMQVSQT